MMASMPWFANIRAFPDGSPCCTDVSLSSCWCVWRWRDAGKPRTRPYRNVIVAAALRGRHGHGHRSRRQGGALLRCARSDRGRYRLTLSDRGQDFGQGFEVGFFPLPGAPSHVLVLQMAMLNFHTGDDNLRYYGLLGGDGSRTAPRKSCPIATRTPAGRAFPPPTRTMPASAPSPTARRWKNPCWSCGRAARSRTPASAWKRLLARPDDAMDEGDFAAARNCGPRRRD